MAKKRNEELRSRRDRIKRKKLGVADLMRILDEEEAEQIGSKKRKRRRRESAKRLRGDHY